jgi:hypothetical protein
MRDNFQNKIQFICLQIKKQRDFAPFFCNYKGRKSLLYINEIKKQQRSDKNVCIVIRKFFSQKYNVVIFRKRQVISI